jgi:hypothetical protein
MLCSLGVGRRVIHEIWWATSWFIPIGRRHQTEKYSWLMKQIYFSNWLGLGRMIFYMPSPPKLKD